MASCGHRCPHASLALPYSPPMNIPSQLLRSLAPSRRHGTFLKVLFALCLTSSLATADVVLVEDGRARAKIFVASSVMEPDLPGAKHLLSEAEKQRERLRD